MHKLIPTLLVFACLLSQAKAQNSRNQEFSESRALARSVGMLVASGGSGLLRADLSKADVPSRVTSWINDNSEAIVAAGKSPFAKKAKWGVATTKGNRLNLLVNYWPEGGKLLVPRLHNSVRSVTMSGQEGELKLKPNVKDWEITLPEKPKRRDVLLPIITMELDGPAVEAREMAPAVKPSQDGSIALHSRYAIVHGEMLRFEPQPHKDTVGYWVNERDWAEWSVELPTAKTYEVELRYGCGNGQGGSKIEIQIGDTLLAFTVEATGGFQAWRDVKLGTVSLPAGKAAVTVKPQVKAKNAIMDIQQITLREQQ